MGAEAGTLAVDMKSQVELCSAIPGGNWEDEAGEVTPKVLVCMLKGLD